jgi:shikimate kinase
MGCGKTTIGRLLAKQIGWSFVDMDTYIENRHQETISELFAKQGESFFRKAEHTSLEEISKSENVILNVSERSTANNSSKIAMIAFTWSDRGIIVLFASISFTYCNLSNHGLSEKLLKLACSC